MENQDIQENEILASFSNPLRTNHLFRNHIQNF